MENWKKKAVALISNLTLSYKASPAVIGYTPQKTVLSAHESPSLKRVHPERHGIPSRVIYDLFSDLEAEERANVHSIIVIKDGEVIAEASRAPYSQNIAHLSHSMTKTVMGMIIGLLYDDGLIDVGNVAADFFPEIEFGEVAKSVTVEHLLTMSSGISAFNELGTVTETDWAKAFFETEFDFAPGESFRYNSMNSYILARIADKLLKENRGVSVIEYLDERILKPLEIENYQWETDTLGIVKGGWGLYMSAESWAKLGLMMLGYGNYGGKQIISSRWVSESIRRHKITPDETGDFDYGYQLWVGRESSDFLFNGMLGQNVWVCPKNNIVVALTSGNNELFQQSPALRIIKKHLGGELAETAARSRKDSALLLSKTESFFSSRAFVKPHKEPRRLLPFLPVKHTAKSLYKRICGSYTVAKNNQGILPIFVRVMQNNYQGGMERLQISVSDDALRITSVEGGVKYEFDAGFYGYKTTELDFCGEKYLLSAMTEASETADGGISYRIELVFPELPNTRRITLTLAENGTLGINMSEIPDEKIVTAFIESLTSEKKSSFVFDLLEKNLGKGFIENKLKELFAPSLIAVDEDASEYESILAAANRAVSDKIASSALIRSLIYSFVGIEDEDSDKSPTNFFASLFGRFFT